MRSDFQEAFEKVPISSRFLIFTSEEFNDKVVSEIGRTTAQLYDEGLRRRRAETFRYLTSQKDLQKKDRRPDGKLSPRVARCSARKSTGEGYEPSAC